MDSELIKYIEKNIIPLYQNFDKAHSTEHVKSVIEESLKLATSLDVKEDVAYTIAAYHDLGLCKGREIHHIVSGEILTADKNLRNWFTDDEIRLMQQAVEDHRASSQNPPRSIYGKIISDADRVIEPEKTITRIIQYSLKHNASFPKAEHYKNVLNHLQNKFSESGYLKLNFTDSPNAKRLENLQKIIKDEKQLYEIFDKLYNTEKSLV